jgi:hypothetical protein
MLQNNNRNAYSGREGKRQKAPEAKNALPCPSCAGFSARPMGHGEHVWNKQKTTAN